MAKKLGETILEDPIYKTYQEKKVLHDNDKELAKLVESFTNVRNTLIAERQNERPDETKCAALNETMRGFYDEIMANPNMTAFNEAASELEGLVAKINSIIRTHITGEEDCGGDCSGCSGCN